MDDISVIVTVAELWWLMYPCLVMFVVADISVIVTVVELWWMIYP